jgi:hypothetical protein
MYFVSPFHIDTELALPSSLTMTNAASGAVSVPSWSQPDNLNLWIGVINFLDQKYLSHRA